MPGIRLISEVTACRQWPQVMPVTWKVVAPMKVRGVLSSKSFSLVGVAATVAVPAAGSHRRNRRVLYAGLGAGWPGCRTGGYRRLAEGCPWVVRRCARGPRGGGQREVGATGRRGRG